MNEEEPKAPAQAVGWLAHPLLSATLAVVWLLLQQSLALPQLLVAAVLGVALPRLLHGFLPAGLGLRSVPAALRLLAVVLWDIVTANLTVARIVLTPGSDPQPAWVPVTLQLRDPVAISLLATIITTTPGTVSCMIDEESFRIFVHALDCQDADALARQIHQRYERPLMEIFG